MKQRGRKSANKRAMIDANRRLSGDDLAQTASDLPQPPSYLAPTTRAWWIDIVHEFEISPHQGRTLECAAQSWDRYQEARQLLAKEGLTFVDSKGMIRAHPLCAVERDNRISYLRALRELGLDKAEPPDHNKNSTVGLSWRDLDR
jgi:P27 family predicted phage terminase small subunit